MVPGTGAHIVVRAIGIKRIVGKRQTNSGKLGAGDGLIRTEGTVGIAIHHAQAGQSLDRGSIPGVIGHVGEGLGDSDVLVQQEGVEHLSHLSTGHVPVSAEGAVGITGEVSVVLVSLQPVGHAAVVGTGLVLLPLGIEIIRRAIDAEGIARHIALTAAVRLSIPAYKDISVPLGQAAHILILLDRHTPSTAALIEGLVPSEIRMIVQSVAGGGGVLRKGSMNGVVSLNILKGIAADCTLAHTVHGHITNVVTGVSSNGEGLVSARSYCNRALGRNSSVGTGRGYNGIVADNFSRRSAALATGSLIALNRNLVGNISKRHISVSDFIGVGDSNNCFLSQRANGVAVAGQRNRIIHTGNSNFRAVGPLGIGHNHIGQILIAGVLHRNGVGQHIVLLDHYGLAGSNHSIVDLSHCLCDGHVGVIDSDRSRIPALGGTGLGHRVIGDGLGRILRLYLVGITNGGTVAGTFSKIANGPCLLKRSVVLFYPALAAGRPSSLEGVGNRHILQEHITIIVHSNGVGHHIAGLCVSGYSLTTTADGVSLVHRKAGLGLSLGHSYCAGVVIIPVTIFAVYQRYLVGHSGGIARFKDRGLAEVQDNGASFSKGQSNLAILANAGSSSGTAHAFVGRTGVSYIDLTSTCCSHTYCKQNRCTFLVYTGSSGVGAVLLLYLDVVPTLSQGSCLFITGGRQSNALRSHRGLGNRGRSVHRGLFLGQIHSDSIRRSCQSITGRAGDRVHIVGLITVLIFCVLGGDLGRKDRAGPVNIYPLGSCRISGKLLIIIIILHLEGSGIKLCRGHREGHFPVRTVCACFVVQSRLPI